MPLAGHETTASSLSWIFERVLRHPEAHECLCSDSALSPRRANSMP